MTCCWRVIMVVVNKKGVKMSDEDYSPAIKVDENGEFIGFEEE